MATTAIAAPTTTTAATPEGKKFVAKPERPNEDHYRKAEAAAKKEYEDVLQQLVASPHTQTYPRFTLSPTAPHPAPHRPRSSHRAPPPPHTVPLTKL